MPLLSCTHLTPPLVLHPLHMYVIQSRIQSNSKSLFEICLLWCCSKGLCESKFFFNSLYVWLLSLLPFLPQTISLVNHPHQRGQYHVVKFSPNTSGSFTIPPFKSRDSHQHSRRHYFRRPTLLQLCHQRLFRKQMA